MKPLFYSIVFLSIVACNGQEESEDLHLETTVEDIITDTVTTPAITDTISKPGETVEYYPNGAVKMRGKLDDQGLRQGLWVAYYDNGIKWSESYYIDGLRDGHTLSFFPNGNVRYVGEYTNDEKTGVWKFYDEDGSLYKEEEF